MERGYLIPESSLLGKPFQSSRQSRTPRSEALFRIAAIGVAAVATMALVGLVSQVQQPASILSHVGVDLAQVQPAGSSIFDESGRYIMRSFDTVKPMASFLPGVGGLWGVPMWTFYVNRGQGLATFGILDKQHGILQFKSAEKAYQNTPYLGFRTLVKGARKDGSSFESQPFFPTPASDAAGFVRNMYIGNNEMEIEEVDPATKLSTRVLYFTAPNEEHPILVRRVTLTNEGSEPVDLEVVDGLAMLEPEGTTIEQINTLGRTLEGWMSVFNFEKDHTRPFFHLRTAAADTADVKPIEEGHFAIALMDADEKEASVHQLLPMICDQQLIFGTDTTLTVPRRFFSNFKGAKGASLAELIAAPQSTTSRTPSAFAAASLRLGAGESKTFSVVFGHAPNVETFNDEIVPKITATGYVSKKLNEARVLGVTLTDRVAMKSGDPRMDGYVKQNYLDNLLRGGMPMSIGGSMKSNKEYPKIYHAFSRIHGDLERDYNNFTVDVTFWSQGPGNFRDVNQNRRCDVLQLPLVHDFNIRQFLSYVQADGYNQLTVATAFFHIDDASSVRTVASQLSPTGEHVETLISILSKPFRPGQLFKDLKDSNILLSMDRDAVLNVVTQHAKQVPAGKYDQNGFWTDHFTYHLDLIHNFLAVFPDQKEAMLYDSEEIPFFLSPGRVANRTEKNMVASGQRIRQYDAVVNSAGKAKELIAISSDPAFVGDKQAGGTWQRTAAGKTMTVSIIAKLVVLAANKFAIMDPLGMGIEMEAGKPGWNDAMNGLAALLGSEMPSAYELHEIIEFVGDTVDEVARPVQLPEEVSKLLTAIDEQLGRLTAGACTDFEYWDKVHDAVESYRFATDATFTGAVVTWSSDGLGRAKGIFGRMLARLDQGVARALARSPDPGQVLSPSYFKFGVSKYTQVGTSAGRELPTIAIEGFNEPDALPLFLEGPTRHLKTLRKAAHSAKLAVYNAVKSSKLYDTKLHMYKISESLKGLPFEVGRMMAFNSGWLENESVWLHMSYKWYLELLRAGLYDEFFKEIQKGVVCFMNTETFGRSPLEATSFIVSSAFPDQTLHGSGFLARLSGSTAEFLSMWNHMMVGEAPFTLDEHGKLQLSLAPVIPSWLWREDGTLQFKFLGAIDVTYVMPTKKASWLATIKSYEISGPTGKVLVDGPVVPTAMAEEIRELKYTGMTVTLV